MTIWFNEIYLAAGVPAVADRPLADARAHRAPVKTRRGTRTRRFARALLTDIGGAVPLGAFEGLRRWRRRSKAIAEIDALDNRMLKDIGIERNRIRESVDALLQAETGGRTS